MRRLAFALALVGMAVSLSPAAEPPKDTPAAAHTRTKKLKGKVTVDFKNEFLKEALKEIAGQLEDQKLGTISYHYAQGVSQNTRITFAGKAITAEEAFEGVLKQLDLGYIIISKDKDRYDGWVEIVKGPNRGYPDGVGTMVAKADPKKPEPKKPEMKEPAKPEEPKKVEDEPKKPAEPKPAEPVTEEDEKMAQAKVDLAKKLTEEGKKDRAKVQLKFVIKKYEGTKAAIEAKELLEKLDK